MTRSAGFALLVGAILLPAAVRLLCYPSYPGSDDAFIHYAVAENVATGRGWGLQAGRSVNLSSSPLFTLISAALMRAGADAWIGIGALSLMASCAGVWLTWWAARSLGLDGLPAALLAATNVHLWRWTGTFLETTVAWAIVPLVIGLDALLRRRRERRPGPWLGLGCLLAVAVLLRYELALLAPALALQARSDRGRARWGAVAAGMAAVLLPWLGFAWSTFGSLLPTTLLAKSAALHWPAPRVLESLAAVAASAAPGGFVLTAVGLIGLGRGGGAAAVGRWAGRWVGLWFPLLAVSLFYAVRMEVLQSPGRYLLPFTPLLALLATAAFESQERGRRSAVVALLAVCLQAALALGINARRVAPVLRGMESGYVAAMEGAAAQLRHRCEPGDEVLVLTDVGVLSVAGTGACTIVDGGGLADPELIGVPAGEIVARRRPRWVVESLGDPERPLAAARGTGLVEVWKREFPSHGIARPDRRFAVRLYELRERRQARRSPDGPPAPAWEPAR